MFCITYRILRSSEFIGALSEINKLTNVLWGLQILILSRTCTVHGTSFAADYLSIAGGKIQLSESSRQLLVQTSNLAVEARGEIFIKVKVLYTIRDMRARTVLYQLSCVIYREKET